MLLTNPQLADAVYRCGITYRTGTDIERAAYEEASACLALGLEANGLGPGDQATNDIMFLACHAAGGRLARAAMAGFAASAGGDEENPKSMGVALYATILAMGAALIAYPEEVRGG
jgi:hypothetical protein